MKREYTYTVHVVVENGIAVDYWTDAARDIHLGGFCVQAVAEWRAMHEFMALDAADAALEARKKRDA